MHLSCQNQYSHKKQWLRSFSVVVGAGVVQKILTLFARSKTRAPEKIYIFNEVIRFLHCIFCRLDHQSVQPVGCPGAPPGQFLEKHDNYELESLPGLNATQATELCKNP